MVWGVENLSQGLGLDYETSLVRCKDQLRSQSHFDPISSVWIGSELSNSLFIPSSSNVLFWMSAFDMWIGSVFVSVTLPGEQCNANESPGNRCRCCFPISLKEVSFPLSRSLPPSLSLYPSILRLLSILPPHPRADTPPLIQLITTM